jgi:hypothetical protein
MPLADSAWGHITCLVADHLISGPDPVGTVKLQFREWASWPWNPAPGTYAATIVRHAQLASLTDPDPLPIRLLEALLRIDAVAVSQDQPQLQRYLDTLRKEKAALDSDDPFSSLIFPGSGEAFIDRVQSRAFISTLVTPEAGKPEPVALRVVGEQQTGKSYTWWFIVHLATARGIKPVRVVLGRSSTAEDILRDLSLKVAIGDEQPDPVADPVKRLRHWAQWLVGQAARHDPGRTWWFVFDQCNELDENSDAVELIAQLAVAIREMTGDGVRRPRMILLGYGDEYADLQLPRKQVFVDQVAPVTEAELRDFFRAVFREIDRRCRPDQMPDDDELAGLVDVAVDQVLQEAGAAVAEGTPFMTAVRRAVEETVDVYEG